jgi:hypothetical protein
MALKPPGAASEPWNRSPRCLMIWGGLTWLGVGIWSIWDQKPRDLALSTLASVNLTLRTNGNF